MKNLLLFAVLLSLGWKVNAQTTPKAEVAEGVHCELRFTDGKAQFQQGETIRVTLAFSCDKPGTFRLATFFQPPPSLIELGHFDASPGENVSRPFGELPPPTMISIAGNVPAPVELTAKPVEISTDLNEYLRFDRPGSYTIQVKTRRVFDQSPSERSGLLFAHGGYEVDSNNLQLEILPTDPAWAKQQVEAQRALWKQPHQEWEPFPVARSFRYLTTPEAMDAIIERLASGERPRSSEDESWFWRISLIGFPDRPWLINEMRRAIAKPETPVTQGLLEDLALLRALEQQKKGITAEPVPASATPSPKPVFPKTSLDVLQEKLLHDEWRRTYGFLRLKTGRARAMTIHSLLDLVWRGRIQTERVSVSKVQNLEHQVPAIFGDLPSLPQAYLLDSPDWRRIGSPAMMKPLLRLWSSPSLLNENYPYFTDSVLVRLCQIASDHARKLVLAEIASPTPRVTMRPLLMLPDRVLPQFDALWLKRLQAIDGNQEMTVQLIKRYASSSIKGQIQAIYDRRTRDKTLPINLDRDLQIYLNRVSKDRH